jgi:hypothetical protein
VKAAIAWITSLRVLSCFFTMSTPIYANRMLRTYATRTRLLAEERISETLIRPEPNRGRKTLLASRCDFSGVSFRTSKGKILNSRGLYSHQHTSVNRFQSIQFASNLALASLSGKSFVMKGMNKMFA